MKSTGCVGLYHEKPNRKGRDFFLIESLLFKGQRVFDPHTENTSWVQA